MAKIRNSTKLYCYRSMNNSQPSFMKEEYDLSNSKRLALLLLLVRQTQLIRLQVLALGLNKLFSRPLHPASIVLLASVRNPARAKVFELERIFPVLTTVGSSMQMKRILSSTTKLETYISLFCLNPRTMQEDSQTR